jgi:PAS domain S-box-containing protein
LSWIAVALVTLAVVAVGSTLQRVEKLKSDLALRTIEALSVVAENIGDRSDGIGPAELKKTIMLSGLNDFADCVELRLKSNRIIHWPTSACGENRNSSLLEAAFTPNIEPLSSVRIWIDPLAWVDRFPNDAYWITAAIGAMLLIGFVVIYLLFQRHLKPALLAAQTRSETLSERVVSLEERLQSMQNLEIDLRAAIGRAEDSERRELAARSQFEEAIAAVPDGFVMYDAEDRLVWCNQKYRDIYEQSAEVIKPGATFEEIIRAGAALGQYAEAVGREKEWVAERMERHRNPRGVIEQQLKDGSWVRIGERRTHSGGIVGFRSDITELKQRESALRESERRNRETINAALDGIIAINTEGRILEFNPAAEDIFGYERSDVIGEDMADLIMLDEHRELHRAGMARLLSTGEPKILNTRIQIEAKRADGTRFPLELTVGAIPQGPETTFVGYMRDISDQQEAERQLMIAKEEAEEASRAKSRFLAMMSHEIRTPMNGILGALGLIEGDSLTRENNERVHIARTSGENLLQILNDILDFSKLEAGKLELEHMSFRTDELFLSVVDLVSVKADARDINLHVDIADSVPKAMVGDVGRIRQVLLNLVSNAIKFSERDDVVISAEISPPEADVEGIRFEVTDHGVGIPGEKQDSLFQEFSQIDDDYVRRAGGTGLGLAISKTLVERMGGQIGFESESGKGSRFWFDLDLAVPELDEPLVDGATRTEIDMAISTVTGRVLLVDDNQVNQFVAKAILEEAGHHVDLAANGLEALEAVRIRPYDLVLMDLAMEEMDGIEATRRIRGKGIDSTMLPIVAMTANVMTEDREKCLAAGMDDFITKPLNAQALIALVARFVSVSAGDKGIAHPVVGEKEHAGRIKDLIDRTVLQDMAAHTRPDVLPGLIEGFIFDTRNRTERLVQAFVEEDLKRRENEAHALVSSAGTFGAKELADVLAAIEQAGRRNDKDELSDCFENFEQIVDESLSALQDLATDFQRRKIC